MNTKTPTVEGLLEFIESQPSNKPINHSRFHTCAVGEYLTSIGIKPHCDGSLHGSDHMDSDACSDFVDKIGQENAELYDYINEGSLESYGDFQDIEDIMIYGKVALR